MLILVLVPGALVKTSVLNISLILTSARVAGIMFLISARKKYGIILLDFLEKVGHSLKRVMRFFMDFGSSRIFLPLRCGLVV